MNNILTRAKVNMYTQVEGRNGVPRRISLRWTWLDREYIVGSVW